MDVLAAMLGNLGKAHDRKDRFEHTALGRAKFDKFKAVETNGIFKQISHRISSG